MPRRAGGWLFTVGFFGLVASLLVTCSSSLGQVVFATDRAEVPHPLEVRGDGGEYTLVLLANPLPQSPYLGNPVAYLRCEVNHPEAQRSSIDGAVALVRNESTLGTDIGRFRTTAGTTHVTCDFKDHRPSSGYHYAVAPTTPSYLKAAVAGLAVSALLLALGVWLLRGPRRSP